MERAGKFLRNASGWLLVGALFYAPWDFGGTTASAIRHLDWLLAVALVLALGAQFLAKPARSQSAFSSRLVLTVALTVLALGWALALNAHYIYDDDYRVFLHLPAFFPSLPGTVDYELSVAWMRRATLLLGCLWMTGNLGQSERWLLRLWWAAGSAGGSIALLGLLQKATEAQGIFWEIPNAGEAPIKTFFSTFYYHGNAGAFLNLILPLILGLAWRYCTRPAHPFVRALWVTFSVIVLAAVAVDTSRMGQFVALLILLVLLFSAAHLVSRRARFVELRNIAFGMFVLGLVLWALLETTHPGAAWQRWTNLAANIQADERWQADLAAFHALPDAGIFGFGPGTFSVVFPHFEKEMHDPTGFWQYLHDDYLQTWLEWGWLGALLWVGVLFGTPAVAARTLLSAESRLWRPRQRALLSLVLIALAGVSLHAWVDFPLQISSLQLYVALYLGFCWSSLRWAKTAAAKGFSPG